MFNQVCLTWCLGDVRPRASAQRRCPSARPGLAPQPALLWQAAWASGPLHSAQSFCICLPAAVGTPREGPAGVLGSAGSSCNQHGLTPASSRPPRGARPSSGAPWTMSLPPQSLHPSGDAKSAELSFWPHHRPGAPFHARDSLQLTDLLPGQRSEAAPPAGGGGSLLDFPCLARVHSIVWSVLPLNCRWVFYSLWWFRPSASVPHAPLRLGLGPDMVPPQGCQAEPESLPMPPSHGSHGCSGPRFCCWLSGLGLGEELLLLGRGFPGCLFWVQGVSGTACRPEREPTVPAFPFLSPVDPGCPL